MTDTTLEFSLSQGQLRLESFINRCKTIATRRAVLMLRRQSAREGWRPRERGAMSAHLFPCSPECLPADVAAVHVRPQPAGEHRVSIASRSNTSTSAVTTSPWINSGISMRCMVSRHSRQYARPLVPRQLYRGDWRSEVWHDNRPTELFCSERRHRGQHVAIAQVNVPIVRAADYKTV